MTTLIKNGTVVSPTGASAADVLIDGEAHRRPSRTGRDVAGLRP